jgi:hypothetical protein
MRGINKCRDTGRKEEERNEKGQKERTGEK